MSTPTDTTTDTTTPETRDKLIVQVWHDYDAESPNEFDGLFRLVSFNNSHRSFGDPARVVDCQYEFEWTDEEYGEQSDICELGPHGPTPPSDPDRPIPPHDYQPPEPIAALLSYFEHGLCRWSRMGHGPADYGGFDTVRFAGVLILCEGYRDGDQFGPWWNDKTDDEKNAVIDSFLTEYTSWTNGETYGYTIERPTGNCPTCDRPNEPEDVDSCGGFIGGDWFGQSLRDQIAYELDIAPGDVTTDHFTMTNVDTAMTAADVLMYAKWADEELAKREGEK